MVHLAETASGMSKAITFDDRFGRGIRAFAVPKGLTSDVPEHCGVRSDTGSGSAGNDDFRYRGSNLISKLVDVFYSKFGIEPRRTDAHMHTGVGLVERFNTSLRDMARAAYFDMKRRSGTCIFRTWSCSITLRCRSQRTSRRSLSSMGESRSNAFLTMDPALVA